MGLAAFRYCSVTSSEWSNKETAAQPCASVTRLGGLALGTPSLPPLSSPARTARTQRSSIFTSILWYNIQKGKAPTSAGRNNNNCSWRCSKRFLRPLVSAFNNKNLLGSTWPKSCLAWCNIKVKINELYTPAPSSVHFINDLCQLVGWLGAVPGRA